MSSYRIKPDSKTGLAGDGQFLSGMDHFLGTIEEHRRTVLLGLVALLVAAAAIGAAVWYYHGQSAKAFELQRQAMQLYLDRPADKPAKADENLKNAIGLFQQVVEQYPRSPVAPLALYHLGNALVQANDLAAAVEVYRKFTVDYGANKNLLGMVYQRLGFAHLLNGDRDQATKALSAVLEVPGASNKDQAIFELGKLEESQSRPEGALARYQELTKDYPLSPFASEAAVRIKALEVKKAPEAGSQQGSAPPPAPPKSDPSK